MKKPAKKAVTRKKPALKKRAPATPPAATRVGKLEVSPEEIAFGESQSAGRMTTAVIADRLEERKTRLLHKAPLIANVVQLDDILESFPVSERAKLRESVKPLVKFEL